MGMLKGKCGEAFGGVALKEWRNRSLLELLY